MAKKWMQKLHIKKGGLHKSLGIAEGKKIPMSRIEAAEHSKSGKVRKQAHLAEVFKHSDHSHMKKHEGASGPVEKHHRGHHYTHHSGHEKVHAIPGHKDGHHGNTGHKVNHSHKGMNHGSHHHGGFKYHEGH